MNKRQPHYVPVNNFCAYMRRAAFALSAALLLGAGTNSYALLSTGTLNDIGNLGGGGLNAWGLSGDGSIGVGESEISPSGYNRGYIYFNGVMTDIGTLYTGDQSFAYAISADGKLVVGHSELTTGGGAGHAFKYTVATSSMVDIGVLYSGSNSYAQAVSANGSLIVGRSQITGDVATHAFKYTVATSSMADLGTLGGTNSEAAAVSADGALIAGYSETAGGDDHAFKYTVATSSMVDIGTLNDVGNSYAFGISANGALIVGQSEITAGGFFHAFKYNVATSSMVDMGTMGGNFSSANAVSADGSVIVGSAWTATASHAFRYVTATSSMTDLGILDGGTQSEAMAVSADGSVIFGDADIAGGDVHAFIYRSSMVDAVNTRLAIGVNAGQLGSLMNLKTSILNSSLDADCAQFGTSGFCLAAGGNSYSGNGNSALRTAANIKAAYRVNSKLHAGIVLDQAFAKDNPGNFSAGNGAPLMGVFASMDFRDDGLGAQARVSAAYDDNDVTITRTVLANTEAGKGKTGFSGLGYSAEFNYGMKGYGWTARPYAALRRTVVTRDGYTEKSGADFPVVYEKVAYRQTTSVLGFDLGREVSRKVFLTLGGGLAYDLSSKLDGYQGVMNTLGSFSLSAPDAAKARLFASAKAAYKLGENKTLSLVLGAYHQSLQSRTGLTAGAFYTLGL